MVKKNILLAIVTQKFEHNFRLLTEEECITCAGAEPSPAYFNILTYNENETVLDGTQLAADWTFSGLQKFGQALLDRLKGVQAPHPLLEKVNISF